MALKHKDLLNKIPYDPLPEKEIFNPVFIEETISKLSDCLLYRRALIYLRSFRYGASFNYQIDCFNRDGTHDIKNKRIIFYGSKMDKPKNEIQYWIYKLFLDETDRTLVNKKYVYKGDEQFTESVEDGSESESSWYSQGLWYILFDISSSGVNVTERHFYPEYSIRPKKGNSKIENDSLIKL